jgi:hypothetical protein
MNKSKYFSLMSIFFVSCNIAQAAPIPISKCDEPESSQRTAQCLYVTGLSDKDQQRWIKTTIPGGFEMTYCTGSLEQVNRYSLMVAYYPIKEMHPTLTADVSICTDQTGTNCKKITSYSFSCTAEEGGQGHCTPVDMPVDISAFKDKFPPCNAHSQPKISFQ